MQVDDLKIIRNEIDNSLKEIAKKYGGKINIGNITYEEDEEEFLEDRNGSIYAGDNFINKSTTNWKYIK